MRAGPYKFVPFHISIFHTFLYFSSSYIFYFSEAIFIISSWSPQRMRVGGVGFVKKWTHYQRPSINLRIYLEIFVFIYFLNSLYLYFLVKKWTRYHRPSIKLEKDKLYFYNLTLLYILDFPYLYFLVKKWTPYQRPSINLEIEKLYFKFSEILHLSLFPGEEINSLSKTLTLFSYFWIRYTFDMMTYDAVLHHWISQSICLF